MYSLSVSGSVVQMHFCGQEIESISFQEGSKSCCCAAAATRESAAGHHVGKQEKSCCDNLAISFKISGDQHIEAAKQLHFLQTVAVAEPLIHYISCETPYVAGATKETYDANAPPPGLWQNMPLYKLFQRIVYYG